MYYCSHTETPQNIDFIEANFAMHLNVLTKVMLSDIQGTSQKPNNDH